MPGVWAPLTPTWGVENRTCAIRVINGRASRRRAPSTGRPPPTSTPTSPSRPSVGAGLYGIDHGVNPPAAVARATRRPRASKAAALPTSLTAATRALAESEAAREMLGEAFVDHYVRTRDWEVREHQKAVTDWELARYFEAV